MKSMHIVLAVTALCCGYAQVITPKPIKVKVYKTDYATWGKPFYYVVQTQKIIGGKKSTTERHTLAPYKPIKKDITISFDTDDENTLWVCPKPQDDDKVCKKLELGNTFDTGGNVVGIDKNYVPTSMSKSDALGLINQSKSKFFKIAVYKTDETTWHEPWKITIVDGKKEPYPDATITIRQDSSFKGGVSIQKNIEPNSTSVLVYKYRQSNPIETVLEPSALSPDTQVLAIDRHGHATIVSKADLKPQPKTKRTKEEGIELQ